METRILVVDDEISMRRVLSQALGRDGYTVVEAIGGEEALEIIRESPPDLVILDIKMPGVNGIEVLKELRKFSDIPVIMLSGLGEVATVHDALSIGADDFIRKPFHMKELEARVRAKLRREPRKE